MFKKNVVMKPGVKPKLNEELKEEDKFEAQSKEILNIIGNKFNMDDIKRLHKQNNQDINLTIQQLKHEQENFEQNKQKLIAQKLSDEKDSIQIKKYKKVLVDSSIHLRINKIIPINQDRVDQIVFQIYITQDIYEEMYKNFNQMSKDSFIRSQQ